MDANLLASAGVSSSSIIGLFVAYKIFQSIKGRRLVSDCCGKKLELGVDVREMVATPTEHPESQKDLEAGHRTVSASHSQPGFASEVVENPKELEKSKSEHMRPPQKDEGDRNAPELSGLTISASKQHHYDPPVRTPPIPSWSHYE